MFAGGGQFGAGRTAQEEETLFYQGYGPTAIDPAALAYYRYERIVEDIAVYCEKLFLSDTGGDVNDIVERADHGWYTVGRHLTNPAPWT
jgi:spectinomycin phosphotransferase